MRSERASREDWIAVFAGALGALMATLDISIVNSALPQIQGEIGASGTEGTWISTGYLVSEVVIIPLAAWLTRVFGMRNLLMGCAVGFTLFSMLCGVSHSLTAMIVGRVGQGFTGGALIPTAQTIVRTRLPPRQLPIGMSLFGLIVLLGPLIGPLLGGWLTENANWSWCFFLNLPVSAGLIGLLLAGFPREEPRLEMLARADWGGILGLTGFLSCLTVVLEEGQRERWLESNLIVWLCAAAALSLLVLAHAQLTRADPVVRLRLMRNPAYASVILIVVASGMVLYGILYVLPQFLSGISGYNAEQSGAVLFVSGVPAVLLMPVLPALLGRVDARWMVACGLLCFAASCFLDVDLTAESGGGDFIASQLLRGLGQMLTMMPLNQASVGAVSREEAADAAGLFNMARNLGGSFGLAILGVFIDRRLDGHAETLREAVRANSPLAQSRISGMAARFLQQGADGAHAHVQALRQLALQIERQAAVITYSECFQLLGLCLVACLPMVLLLRPPSGLRTMEMH